MTTRAHAAPAAKTATFVHLTYMRVIIVGTLVAILSGLAGWVGSYSSTQVHEASQDYQLQTLDQRMTAQERLSRETHDTAIRSEGKIERIGDRLGLSLHAESHRDGIDSDRTR